MAKFRQLNPSSENESMSADRKTGWFTVSDLGRTVFIRRINARHVSGDDLSITLFTDGDSSVESASTTFRANSGDSGVNLAITISETATSITTDSTTKFKNGDWIKITTDEATEIIKIISAGSTVHTVQRGMRGTTADAHNSGTDIYYANFPNDSIRIGKRAKYAQIQITAPTSSNSVEINKLEIEYQ
jgi:hypothetical protein